MKIMRVIVSILALVSTAVVDAQAASSNDLDRCSETGYVGSSADSCGGDDLTRGIIQVSRSGKVAVTVTGAEADPLYPYNLYEVYWLPVGEAVTSAQLIGNFVTDCNGNSIKNSGRPGIAWLKTISKAADITSTSYSNIYTLVGNISSGVFLVYDRGPYSYTSSITAPCNPATLSEYNTTTSPNDGSAAKSTTPFANPVVVPDYRIQFMSGYHN
ncbi:MAG: hypothetical protein EPN21_01680 [Methylococcaceae bacterium]|nr:MAG: hypothetical protein EPN21_01680 [Methylococcaceae bacterium]